MARDDIRSEIWDIKKVPDLTGKVAIVTGANDTSALGFNVAQQLALKGAKVYIGARSEAKAQTAVDAIVSAHPSIPKANLGTFIADMSDLNAVKAAAEKFVATETRLDILINNAAMLPHSLVIDKNGISVSMVTNHLSVFLLVRTLLPLIKKTAESSPGVRIVTLSSGSHAHVPVPVRFDSVEAFNVDLGGVDKMPFNYYRYCLSKLANVLFAKELQKKLDAEGIDAISVSLHPGGVKTTGAIGFAGGDANSKILDGTITPLEGTATPLFAATAPEVYKEKSKYGGAYLMPFGVPSPEDESAFAKDPTLATELWATSEKILADVLSK